MAGAADLTAARIAAILARGEYMRGEDFVNLFKHFGDAQIGGFGQGGAEIAPETVQHVLVIGVTRADLIQLVFQIGGKVELDIFAKVICEEYGDKAAFVLWNQAALVFSDVIAVLNRRDDRGIGRRAANAKFLHSLDQRGLGIAGGRLGEMLFRGDIGFGRSLARHDLWQAGVVIIGNRIIAAFFVDRDKSLKQNHLAGGAQGDLAIS